jgi:hypothetical protein
MELTMDNAEDFLQRELPLTYDEAIPLRTFRVEGGVVIPVHTLA